MTQQSALYKKFEVVLLDKSGKGGNWIDNLQDILDKHSISADCIADIIDDVFANNPDAKFIYSRYALLLMKHGFTDMAEQAFQKDYSYYNQAWSHSMKYAECLTINNKHNQAEELIQKVYGRHPGAVNGYTASAMVLFSRGYPETASRFALKDLFQRRFTSFYLKHIVKILLSTGERQTAIDEINKIVSEKSNLEFSGTADIFREENELEMAASLYDIDLSRGVIQDRAVQSYFNLALELSDTDKALALIAHCDASGFVIKDAYSRIASILYSENKNHRSFIDMSSKDLLHGDISPKFSMMLAKAYALLDDAENAVKMADYTCSICNQTKDIYSSIASILYFEKKDFRSFIEMSSKDLPSGRISPTYSMMLAKAYALLDDAENSVKMADYTCSICNQTKDVYSRIANILYLKKKDFRSFIELSSKDLPDGRISPTSSMLLAKAYAMLNDAENSVKMVEYTYSICPETKDGFSLIAANLSITTPSEYIFSLYKRDIELGRMTSYGASQLASFLVESDRADSLTEIGELLYSAFPDISDFYSSAASVQFEKMNIEEAFRLYEMDFSLDKISAEHMSAYIRSLAKFGRINKAFELLKDCMDKDSIFYPPAYSELLPHPDIKNIEPPEIKQLSAEDESIHNLALYYASASRFVDSNIISEKVNQLYEAAERLKDVFSSCARAALEDGNIEKAKKYFELDYKKKRMEYYSYFQYSEIIDSEKPKKYGFSILSSGGKKDRWLQNSKDMHKGESCFVVGTGPSLKDVDTSMLKKCPVFGVNGVFYKEGLNITYYTTISNFFWHHHTEQIKNVKCERRFILDRFKNELSSHVPTSWINSLPPEYKDIAGQKMLPPFFFSKNPEKAISLGGTVLFVCLQLAFHMGFKKVYLLGADHNYGQPESINKAGIQNIIETESQPMHFSGNQFPQGFFPIDMQGCEKAFNISKSVFEADGRKIFNATKGSRLNIFEKVNLEDIV